MHALAKTRVHQMARRTNTRLTPRHFEVLEYAWNYYREHSVGPLFRNIERATGADRSELDQLFPHGIASVHTWVGIPVQGAQGGCKPMALVEVENLREVYLDHNATTPLRPEVTRALVEFLQDPRSFGNPSSAYLIGSAAYEVVERAREQVAECLSVSPAEIYFVASGSEANNLALRGAAEVRAPKGGHIVTSNVEHPSVLQTVRYLETRGYTATYLGVRNDGTLTARDVEGALRPNTFLVAVMAANNEIGTLYPIAEMAALCRQRGVLYMTDAVQAFGKIPISPRASGISLLSGSGHKLYAPKGAGFLFVDAGVNLMRQVHGGAQERSLRAGTENVAGILALGLAAKLACQEMESERQRQQRLRDYFLQRLGAIVPDAVINGALEPRLPHNLSLGFPNVDSGSLLLSLNQIGVYVSAGSACSAGENKSSHVLTAIGVDEGRMGTLRFSFGRNTSEQDLDYLFEHLPRILQLLRSQPPQETAQAARSARSETFADLGP